ncbi:hypothetical protein NDU88_004344 [Pleurodeles waltl]|uniref:Uncharacterized protein n=1 Tax=Pleurodeles waltl TaxID=8319 RepID=A0AAV7QFN0_PLEWA|nr:hypothetical protein NDU88_004344 [Pleurodeles waltl]
MGRLRQGKPQSAGSPSPSSPGTLPEEGCFLRGHPRDEACPAAITGCGRPPSPPPTPRQDLQVSVPIRVGQHNLPGAPAAGARLPGPRTPSRRAAKHCSPMVPGQPERAPEAQGSGQGKRSATDPGGSRVPPPPLGSPSGAFSARGPSRGLRRSATMAERVPPAQHLYLMGLPNEGALLHFLS